MLCSNLYSRMCLYPELCAQGASSSLVYSPLEDDEELAAHDGHHEPWHRLWSNSLWTVCNLWSCAEFVLGRSLMRGLSPTSVITTSRLLLAAKQNCRLLVIWSIRFVFLVFLMVGWCQEGFVCAVSLNLSLTMLMLWFCRFKYSGSFLTFALLTSTRLILEAVCDKGCWSMWITFSQDEDHHLDILLFSSLALCRQ